MKVLIYFNNSIAITSASILYICQKFKLMKQDRLLKRLFNTLIEDKRDIFSIYFFAILSGLVELSVPLGVQAIISFFLGSTMVTSIYVLIFIVVFCVFLVGLIQINQWKIIEKIQQQIFVRYAFAFAEKIQVIDLKKVNSYYLPEKMNRFFDTVNLQKGISKLLLEIPSASIQIILGIALLALYHPIFIAMGLILLIVLYFLLKLTSKKGLLTSLEESTHKYAVVSWLEEMGRTVKTIKLSQGTQLNLNKTDQHLSSYLGARTSHFNVLLIQFRILVLFKVFITAGMLIIGTYLLLNQELNIGEFIATEIVIISIIAAVEKLIRNMDTVYDVITGIEKLESFTDSPSESDGTLPISNEPNGLAVELKQVEFEFEANKPILQQLNFKIPEGSKVCIQGGIGSGKSSLLSLLSFNYPDFKGSFLINDIPLQNYKLESLRQITGKCSHQSDLFEGTVWENITLNRFLITPELVVKLAKQLGIDDFMHQLPLGFETKIDPLGKQISFVTARKIVLLRSLIHQPRLLLMEEPWNGLNPEMSAKIQDFLLNNLNTCTTFVASNDPVFASKCDYIIELTNGFATLISKNDHGKSN